MGRSEKDITLEITRDIFDESGELLDIQDISVFLSYEEDEGDPSLPVTYISVISAETGPQFEVEVELDKDEMERLEEKLDEYREKNRRESAIDQVEYCYG